MLVGATSSASEENSKAALEKGKMQGHSPLKNGNAELKENSLDDGLQKKNTSRSLRLLAGIFNGCLKPVCGFFAKGQIAERDPWIIPFNALTEIRLVGSGAQGAVFLGHYKSEEVAIKKVKNEKDTDIRHLRHLDHKNIVKFR